MAAWPLKTTVWLGSKIGASDQTRLVMVKSLQALTKYEPMQVVEVNGGHE